MKPEALNLIDPGKRASQEFGFRHSFDIWHSDSGFHSSFSAFDFLRKQFLGSDGYHFLRGFQIFADKPAV